MVSIVFTPGSDTSYGSCGYSAIAPSSFIPRSHDQPPQHHRQQDGWRRMSGQLVSLTWSHNRMTWNNGWAYGTLCRLARQTEKKYILKINKVLMKTLQFLTSYKPTKRLTTRTKINKFSKAIQWLWKCVSPRYISKLFSLIQHQGFHGGNEDFLLFSFINTFHKLEIWLGRTIHTSIYRG